MSSRRQKERDLVFLPVFIEILDKNKKNILGFKTFQSFTHDLNQYGACLEIRNFDINLLTSINIEDKYIFKLYINLPNFDKDIIAYARPIWGKEEERYGSSISKIGVSFLDINRKDVVSIIKYIHKIKSFSVYVLLSVFSFFLLFLVFYSESYKNSLFSNYYFNKLSDLKKEKIVLGNHYRKLKYDYSILLLDLEKAKNQIANLQKELNLNFSLEVEKEIKKLSIKKIKIENKIKKVEKKTKNIEIRQNKNEEIFISLSQSETDILYNWLKSSQVFKTGLVGSYEGSRELSGISFTYDEALCVDIFVARNDFSRAKYILDFFLNKATKIENGYAFFNAYSKNSGNVLEWISHVGPNVWLGMSILHYLEKTKDDVYLDIAKKIADYVSELQDNYGGIRGGEGINWYSTEHNLDSYAFFRMLYKITKENKYKYFADKVLRWLLEDVYIKDENRFMRGKNDRVVATDTVSFGIPAIGPKLLYEKGIDPEKLIEYIENKTKNITVFKNDKNEIFNVEGFDYTDYKALNREPVVSSEWTAQMVTTYKVMADYFKNRNEEKYKYYMNKVSFYLNELSKMIIRSEEKRDMCGLPYATRAMVDTGHGWFTPSSDDVISIAGTAYDLLARLFINPFMLESEKNDYFGD